MHLVLQVALQQQAHEAWRGAEQELSRPSASIDARAATAMHAVRTSLRHAIALAPTLGVAYYNLGTALRRKDASDAAAAEVLGKAVALGPRHVLAYLNLGTD